MKPLLNLFLLFMIASTHNGMDVSAQAETWLRYPVDARGLGEGGQFEADLTIEPATAATLSFVSGDSFILASREISVFLKDDPDVPEVIRLERTEPGIYEFVYGEEREPGNIHVWLRTGETDDVMQGAEHIFYVMGEASEQFLLAPADAPDPRPTEGQRCNGGQRVRLNIGGVAATGTASGEVNFYENLDDPASVVTYYESRDPTSSVGTFVNTVYVIAGPLCVGPVAWWQVSLSNDSDSVGWIPKMFDDGGYLLHPLVGTIVSPPVACDGAPETRLSLGAYITPVEAAEPPALHPAPGSSTFTTTIPAEAFYLDNAS